MLIFVRLVFNTTAACNVYCNTTIQQQYQQNHNSSRKRRIANNKQRRLVNRRHRQQHTSKQKQSHRQAQFASTSQKPQQSNNTATSQTTNQSNTQTTVQTSQLAAPKCGPTSGTHHSPYIGCYTDKLNDRIMSFELPNKYHSVLTCEKQCSDRKVPRLYLFISSEFTYEVSAIWLLHLPFAIVNQCTNRNLLSSLFIFINLDNAHLTEGIDISDESLKDSAFVIMVVI